MDVNAPTDILAAQRRYARCLAWGTRIGLALLVASFIVMLTGFVPLHVPIERLPELWSQPASTLLAQTHVSSGWGWASALPRADMLVLLAIAFIASVSAICLAAVVPIFAAQRSRMFVAICLLGIAVLVLAASGILASSAHARTLSGDVLRIGVLTDMTGPYADPTGEGSVVGAQLAIDEFGGRMFGKPIQLLSADHQNKPDIGAARARTWFDVDGVDMVTDVPNSAVALAVARLAADKRRAFLAVGAATTRLTNEDCNPFTIHWMYDTYSLASGTAKAVARAGGDTWFFLTADYAFGHALEKDAGDVLKAMGAKVLGQARHPLNASDFSSFMVQAQASKAKIIGLANAGGDAINAVKSANEFGLTPRQTLAGLLVNLTDVHSLGLDKAQGMLVTEGFYWDLDERTRAFARRYFERTKRMPSAVQAGVYSATLNYLRAVQAAGTDEAHTVIAELRRNPIDDAVVRNATIRRDGRLMKPMYLLKVKAPSESKGPWDYYTLVHTLPADDAFQPLDKSRCAMR